MRELLNKREYQARETERSIRQVALKPPHNAPPEDFSFSAFQLFSFSAFQYLSMLMRRFDAEAVFVHGFRSARDDAVLDGDDDGRRHDPVGAEG